MLVGFGLKKLFKKPGRVLLSIFTLSMGIFVFFGSQITIDTVEQGFIQQQNFMYGNVTHTIYNSSGLFANNENNSLPLDMLDQIKSIEGVNHAVARVGAGKMVTRVSDTSDTHGLNVFGINATDPDESFMGRGIVVDCLPEIGEPENLTLEDLLQHPSNYSCVISTSIANDKGWSIGEKIYIRASNLTKAYATQDELDSVANGTITKQELEASIAANKTRWEQYTIIGIYLDGAEALARPIPHKDNSLNDIIPNPNTVYLRMEDAKENIFNLQTEGISYFMISAGQGFNESAFKSNFTPLGISIFNIQDFLDDYTVYFTTLLRAVFIVIVIISTFMCAMLIKTIMQMNLKEQFYEIGVLRSLGVKKRHVAEYLLSQSMFLMGSSLLLGVVLGTQLPNMIDLSYAIEFLSYNKVYEMQIDMVVVISPTSLIISVVAGVLFPLVAALWPLKDLNLLQTKDLLERNDTPLNLAAIKYQKAQKQFSALSDMKSRMKKGSFLLHHQSRYNRLKKKTRRLSRFLSGKKEKKAQVILLSIALLLGFVLFWFAATNMFEGYTDVQFKKEDYIWLAAIALCMFLILGPLLTLINRFFHSVVSFFSRFFALKHMRAYLSDSVRFRSRNVKNFTTALTVAVFLIVFMLGIYSSARGSNVMRNRTSLGADVVVYDPMLDISSIPEISSIPGVDSATLYLFNSMQGFRFFSLQSDVATLNVNRADAIGGKRNNKTENVNVLIIEPDEYISVNIDEYSRSDIERPLFTSFPDAVRMLKQNHTVIIQDELAKDTGKDVGDSLAVEVFGIQANLTVVAVANLLPGCPTMFSLQSDQLVSYMMVFSRDTLKQMASDFMGHVDIVIKNKDLTDILSKTNETVDEDMQGYLSGPFSKTTMSTHLAIEGITNVSYKFATFAPTIPKITVEYNETRLLYKQPNATIVDSEGTLPLPSRLYIQDPREEIWMQHPLSERILEHHPQYSSYMPEHPVTKIHAYMNSTPSELLYLTSERPDLRIDGYPSIIMNKHVASYNERKELVFVHENKIGDIVTIANMTEDHGPMQFKIIGLVDTRLPFTHANGTEREGLLFSRSSLNYNFNKTNSSFLNVFDMDANVALTSFNELINQTSNPFGYLPDDLYNYAQVKVEPGKLESVLSNLEMAFEGTNYTAFAFKTNFLSKITAGSLAIKLEEGWDAGMIAPALRSWYIDNGYQWKESSLGHLGKFSTDITILEPLFGLIRIVAITTFFIALISLASNVYLELVNRRNEMGILRSLGVKRKTIFKLVFAETFSLTFTGAMIGLACGLSLFIVLIESFSLNMLFPLFLSIPITEVSFVLAATIIASIASSYANARMMLKERVVQNLASP